MSSVLVISCSDTEGPDTAIEAKVDSANTITAITVKTQFLATPRGKLAYRVLGSGKPLILCNRFRGTMDDWDPKFLDELAKDYEVAVFDYSGIGLSTLLNEKDSLSELADVEALAQKLGFKEYSLLGWSHGGKVAQVYTARHFREVEKLVLLGTGPIGKTKYTPEKIFLDYALKPVNNFEDEIVLFFEPKYEESRQSAKASHDRIRMRTSDTSKYVTPDKFGKYFQTVAVYNNDEAAVSNLVNGKVPILAISGEHDIVFPIESWYEQTRKNPNLQIIMLPKAGHGPQSQYPLLAARYIANFLSTNE